MRLKYLCGVADKKLAGAFFIVGFRSRLGHVSASDLLGGEKFTANNRAVYFLKTSRKRLEARVMLAFFE